MTLHAGISENLKQKTKNIRTLTGINPDINRIMVDCHKILGQAHSFVCRLEELGALSKKNADQWRKDSDELKDRMKEHITSELPTPKEGRGQ